jgi:UDP-N-acetylmuramate dehydrogenase
LVDTKTGVTKSLALNALSFGYRQSAVSENQLVTKAILRLSEGDADESLTIIKEIVRWRIENQPGGQNAGSVFTNPKENSAGRLIDESGCKGLRVGSAEISRKHANFIQVDTGGKAQDVKDLMNLIQERVYSKFGVYLKEETQMIGFS